MTYRNVDDINDTISQLSGIVCGQIVTTTFHKEELATKFGLQSFQSAQIGAYIFSDCRMRTSSRLDGEDAIFWKSLVLD